MRMDVVEDPELLSGYEDPDDEPLSALKVYAWSFIFQVLTFVLM